MEIKRYLRCIKVAVCGHAYQVERYVEYSNGDVKFVASEVIKINETKVRRRQLKHGGTVWEASSPGNPGWFLCDNPPNVNCL